MRKRSPGTSRSPERSLLLAILDEAYDAPAWHGPNLKGSIRRVTEEEAVWRPAPGRNSVWELVVHAAYWKYAVRRRLTGEKRGSFPLAGSNFFRRPMPGRSWRDDVALLEDEHGKLREVIAALPAAQLPRRAAGTRHTAARTIYGVAAHDTYHAGQIRLLRALQKKAGR